MRNDQYFRLEANVMSDDRIYALTDALGMEGFGVYMGLLIELRQRDEYVCAISSIKSLARKWGVTLELLARVVNDFGLFCFHEAHGECVPIGDTETFCSPYLNRVMSPLDRRRRASAENGEKGSRPLRRRDGSSEPESVLKSETDVHATVANVVGVDAVNAEGVNAGAANARAINARAANAEVVNVEGLNADAVNAEGLNTDGVITRAVNAEAANARVMNAKSMNGRTAKVQVANAEGLITRAMNAEAANARVMNTKSMNGRTAKARVENADGLNTDAVITRALTADGVNTDAAKARVMNARAMNAKAANADVILQSEGVRNLVLKEETDSCCEEIFMPAKTKSKPPETLCGRASKPRKPSSHIVEKSREEKIDFVDRKEKEKKTAAAIDDAPFASIDASSTDVGNVASASVDASVTDVASDVASATGDVDVAQRRTAWSSSGDLPSGDAKLIVEKGNFDRNLRGNGEKEAETVACRAGTTKEAERRLKAAKGSLRDASALPTSAQRRRRRALTERLPSARSDGGEPELSRSLSYPEEGRVITPIRSWEECVDELEKEQAWMELMGMHSGMGKLFLDNRQRIVELFKEHVQLYAKESGITSLAEAKNYFSHWIRYGSPSQRTLFARLQSELQLHSEPNPYVYEQRDPLTGARSYCGLPIPADAPPRPSANAVWSDAFKRWSS